MGFMARRLFNMERQNNERIVEILTATVNPSVKVELSEAACHEEVTKHSSILLTLPNGETINQYRCRMRWFMSAPGQPTLPMGALSATDANQSAWGIATVVNDLVKEMEEATAASHESSWKLEKDPDHAPKSPMRLRECIQCGEETDGSKFCNICQ